MLLQVDFINNDFLSDDVFLKPLRFKQRMDYKILFTIINGKCGFHLDYVFNV